MLNTIRTGFHRIGEHIRHRRDYDYLMNQADDRLLRDIGVDRIEVSRRRHKLGLF